jgi:hypothetical protein
LALIEAQGSETPCKSLRAFLILYNMKQVNLFGQEFAPNQDEKKYSSKIEAPIYEPKNKQPHLLELVNKEKTHRLMKEIESSNLGIDEKMFLMDAARRHNVFNYEKVADYYAHCTPEMQQLMERSGLVLIDFENAIQYGFVKLSEEIKTQYLTEYGE